jgi:tellurite methyltransferase
VLKAELHRILETLKPGRALDLACGRGGNAVFLAERGWRVIAVDRDGEAIAAIPDHINIAIRVMDLEQESIARLGSFELILAWRYFQAGLFDVIRQQLTPGGVFATAVKTSGRFAAQLSDVQVHFADWHLLYADQCDGFAALIVQQPL